MNTINRVVSSLAIAFFEQTLRSGGSISIPPLGITIGPLTENELAALSTAEYDVYEEKEAEEKWTLKT